MFFSIIIPVYNVKDYLKDCIESVLKQTFIDYEIILLDDGSTDGSAEICDKYASVENIMVVHKLNEGPSVARNEGIRLAKGDYIIFLDSDDFFSENKTLDKMYKIIIKKLYNLYYSNYLIYYTDGKNKIKKIIFPFKYFSSLQFQLYEMYGPQLVLGSPFFVYKRDFLLSNQLFFKSGILHEDLDWFQRIIVTTDKIGIMNYPFYCYRLKRKGSITNSFSNKNVESLLYITDRCNSDAEKTNLFKKWFALTYSAQVLSYIILNPQLREIAIKNYKKEIMDRLPRLLKSKKITHHIRYFMIRKQISK